jgi:sulfide:quinone oxidoreductase
MSDYKPLTSNLAVAPQIRPEDLPGLARAGFRSLINNRPDNEDSDQPSSAELEKAAHAAGLTYFHQPVAPNAISNSEGLRFAALVLKAPGPVLAFCRTGTRSASLWALAESPRTDPQTLKRTAREAGYDLDRLDEQLNQRWQQHAGQNAHG